MSPAYKRLSAMTPEERDKFKDILSRMANNRENLQFYQEFIATIEAEYIELEKEHAEFMSTIEIEGT